jgi:hypothetical protein
MIRFWEVFRCAGVDHDPRHPSMVIPFGGSNLVGVQHHQERIELVPNTSALEVAVVDTSEMIRARTKVYTELSQPGVDPMLVKGYMPDNINGSVRYYRVTGRRKADFDSGAKLKILANNKPQGEMPVVVVDPLPVKIAIRDVKIYDSAGVLKYHSTKPADAGKELDVVNEVWTPQTQMKFELISAPPAIIDDRDPKVKETIRQGLGLKDLTYATLADTVQTSKLKELFAPHRVAGADVTIFFVDKIHGSSGSPSGRTEPSHAMIFMAANRYRSTLAHELGHYLGGEMKNGVWDGFDHTYDTEIDPKTKERRLADEDYRMLMRDGGSGYKIPFNFVKMFRTYKARLPKTK